MCIVWSSSKTKQNGAKQQFAKTLFPPFKESDNTQINIQASLFQRNVNRLVNIRQLDPALLRSHSNAFVTRSQSSLKFVHFLLSNSVHALRSAVLFLKQYIIGLHILGEKNDTRTGWDIRNVTTTPIASKIKRYASKEKNTRKKLLQLSLQLSELSSPLQSLQRFVEKLVYL